MLDQANNPRRLVAHDDDSDVRSCAYPCAPVLGGIRGWAPRDRLSLPLHGVERQSQPWGTCIILASRREEFHLYGTQVIKDLSGPSPSSLTDHVISRERIAASPCTWFSHAPSPMATLTPFGRIRGFRSCFQPPTSALLPLVPRVSHVPIDRLTRDRVGGGYPSTSPRISRLPSGRRVYQVRLRPPLGG